MKCIFKVALQVLSSRKPLQVHDEDIIKVVARSFKVVDNHYLGNELGIDQQTIFICNRGFPKRLPNRELQTMQGRWIKGHDKLVLTAVVTLVCWLCCLAIALGRGVFSLSLKTSPRAEAQNNSIVSQQNQNNLDQNERFTIPLGHLRLTYTRRLLVTLSHSNMENQHQTKKA